MMMTSPTTPSTIFWGLGALTIGSKIAGSGMSALEAAGDLEGDQARGLARSPPGADDVGLTDRPLELRALSLALGDRAREVPLLQGERPPVGHGPDDRDHVHDGEKRAEVEARERERRKAEAPPSLRLGRQVDPDHLPLSPGRLSPSPTATASAGPAALTSSP